MLKKELRKIYKSKRIALSNKERNKYSEEIFKLLETQIDIKGKVVSIYAPIERFAEINTYPLLQANESTFILPVLNNEELSHIKFEDLAQLKTSDWGIPEPSYGETFDPKDIDVVLVPMLVFDLEGYRVGYGKGFYDKFLEECSKDCIFIGVSIFPPIKKITDVHSHDIGLHMVITPNKVYSF